jgi:hypothetical protein
MTQIRQPDSGMQPAEGRDDLDIPGADVSGPPSEHPDAPMPGIQPTRDLADEPDSRERDRRDELRTASEWGCPARPLRPSRTSFRTSRSRTSRCEAATHPLT